MGHRKQNRPWNRPQTREYMYRLAMAMAISWVRSAMMEISAQLAENGAVCHPPFTLSTLSNRITPPAPPPPPTRSKLARECNLYSPMFSSPLLSGIALQPCTPWARIFKHLRSPGIDSKEPILPGCVVWRAGAENPIPTRFLAHTDCLRIPAPGLWCGGKRTEHFSVASHFVPVLRKFRLIGNNLLLQKWKKC